MTAKTRYLEADRAQLRWDVVDLESLSVSDHRARIVWAFVQGVVLSAFYAPIKARESEPGRPAADPKVVLALWLYATLEGVGSARHLDRLCQRDSDSFTRSQAGLQEPQTRAYGPLGPRLRGGESTALGGL